MEMQVDVGCAHVADCTDIEFEKEEFASHAKLFLPGDQYELEAKALRASSP